MSNINLDTKLVGKIAGNFFLPAYQRGYRWSEEVKMLLDDISEIPEAENYCLQPIVVKKTEDDKYELIDGQQRLTTIYLIYQYMRQLNLPFEPAFSLEYETRDLSDANGVCNSFREFLANINADTLLIEDAEIDNIDKYYAIKAYKSIAEWFTNQENKVNTAINFYNKLNNHVHVIWYEVDSNEKSEALFTRLNIGRIPLTNAELVRALFLSHKSGVNDAKQNEIALQWDNVERELQNDSLWYFITNRCPEDYPTRIEIIFDLMADKPKHIKEKFHTFFIFVDRISAAEKKSTDGKSELWTEILRSYQRLKGWYETSDMYHKIGYLIASDTVCLSDLLSQSEKKTKSEFEDALGTYISDTIKIDKEWSELSYESDKDYGDIERILLLFNVETIRQKNDETMRFPFNKHKQENWTLEHIHARQSESLNKLEQWITWLREHKKSLECISQDTHRVLITDISTAINNTGLTGEEFRALSERVVFALSEENEDSEYIHSLSNLALLGFADNAELNNSTFSVKRNKILDKDKKYEYIPECTRRVFLKYYTASDSSHLHYWGKADREAYLEAINKTLKDYLPVNNKETEGEQV